MIFGKMQMKSVQFYKKESTSQIFFREFAKFSEHVEMVTSEKGDCWCWGGGMLGYEGV